MEVSTSVTYITLFLCSTLPLSNGHGMMVEPSMRSSLWRFDYSGSEPNYNDNGLNCGGFTNLHEQQKGRCGVCGDPYQGPRDNEAGGKYAKGIIARTYKSGQYITVVSDITANHGGYIELKLCPHNNFQRPVTQQCLNQNILLIKGHGTRYFLTSKQKSDFKIHHTVKLPDFVTCRQCVLQWYWRAGQHNGIDPKTKKECMGCGKQEEFINCADIAITDQFGMFPSVTTTPPVTTPYPIYDSYMYQNPGMFPEYFDEYSPHFNQPMDYNPFQDYFMTTGQSFQTQTSSPFISGGNVQRKMPRDGQFNQNTQRNMPSNRGFNSRGSNMRRNMAPTSESYVPTGRNMPRNRGFNGNPTIMPSNMPPARVANSNPGNIRRNMLPNRRVNGNPTMPPNRRVNGNPNMPPNRRVNGNPNMPPNRRVNGNPNMQPNRKVNGNPTMPPNRRVNGNPNMPPNRRVNGNPNMQPNRRVNGNPNMQPNRRLNSNINNMPRNMPPNRRGFPNTRHNERYSGVPRNIPQNRDLNRHISNRHHHVGHPSRNGPVKNPRHQGNHISNNRRPVMSRNNRPQINIHGNMRSQVNPNDNRINNNRINNNIINNNRINNNRINKPAMKRNNKSIQTNRIIPIDESEASTENELDITGNAEFWADFNKLLNMSSPENKEALYEFADDADNIEELHQNIKLMLQMQNGVIQSIDQKDSESDESLDMDWLLNEAKDFELDSDEQNLLGINKKMENEGEKDEEYENDQKKFIKKSQMNIGNYDSFDDENRILDDSDSGGSYSDALSGKDQSESLETHHHFDDNSDLSNNDDINDYDDSEDSYAHSEVKADNHLHMNTQSNKLFNSEEVSQNGVWSESKYAIQRRRNPWNDNSLYKKTSIDYDDKDVDTEGEFTNQFESQQKFENPIQTIASEERDTNVIHGNYFESDTRDYTDSEFQNEEDDTTVEIDKSWEDENNVKDDFGDDSWSYDTVPDAEADSNTVTIQKENNLSEEAEYGENSIAGDGENEQSSSKSHHKKGHSKDETTEKDNEHDETQTIPDTDKEINAKDDNEQETNGEKNKDIGSTGKIYVDDVPAADDMSKDALDVDDKQENVKNPDDSVLDKIKTDLIDVGSPNEAMEEVKRGFQEEARATFQEGGLKNEEIDKMSDINGIMDGTVGDQLLAGRQTVSTRGVLNNQAMHGQGFIYNTPKGRYQMNGIGNRMRQMAGSAPPQNGWITPTTVFSNTMSNIKHSETVLHNINDHKKTEKFTLSKLRRKMQDKISKSTGKKDSPNMAKLIAGSKKELSPKLSKLVLKMFMNSKSEMPSCPGGSQSLCYPVTQWSKYQQVADWCTSLCPYGQCPSAVCLCNCESKPNETYQKTCKAQSSFKEKAGELDQWCQKTCSVGDCPELLCVCT